MEKHAQLIADYKAEYLRTAGKEIALTYERGWFSLGTFKDKLRRAEIEVALGKLKQRPTKVL